MDKKDFLNFIPCNDKVLLSNIYDKIILASKTEKTVFTNEFYPMSIWNHIDNLQDKFDVEFRFSGVFQEAERRMLAFTKKSELIYPIKLLEIRSKSKFEMLQHKDYLGSIMSLGIRREKFGDLVLNNDVCYIPVCEDISGFIIGSLDKIKRSPCSISIINDIEEIQINRNFEEKVIITTSMRLDCVVSSICKLSRSKAEDLIKGKKVMLDSSEEIERARIVKNNNVLSIRGFGKFMIIGETSKTSSDRIKLLIKKYI